MTLLTATALFVAWFLLLFVAQVPSGNINLLYGAAIILFARRIMTGAPKFLS
ncbi:MAG TPA: hypothetical protein VH439_13545 [Gemmatimonadales bacterium]